MRFTMSKHASTPGSVISDRNSPETKLTPFSPLNPRSSTNILANSGAKIVPPMFVLQGITNKGGAESSGPTPNSPNAQDPFTNTSVKAKLSPTANNFTPLEHYSGVSPALSTFQEAGIPTISYLMRSSIPEMTAHRFRTNENVVFPPSECVPPPVGGPSLGSTINSFYPIHEECSRYLMITNVFKSSTHEEIEAAFSVRD